MKKKYKLKIGRLLLVIILAGFGVSLLVIGINKNIISVNAPIVNSKKYNEIPKPKVEESKISLIAVGDALIHGAIYQNVQKSNYDFKPTFSEVKNVFSSYDLRFYNQETILGGKELGLSTYPQFNSPTEVGDAFMDMGFNLVSLATNHTLDRGDSTNWKTIKNSREYWNKQENVIAAGSYATQKEKDEVIVKEKNGIKYGLLAYTTLTNGLTMPKDKRFYLNVYSDALAKKDIEALRDKVDVLIVSMHWGIEYSHGVSPEQKAIAKYLSSLGVDIIIGTHPHVVEPIEYINNTLVIYSLGNFVSSQIGNEKLTGLVAAVDITKTTIDGKSVVKLSNTKADLVYTCKPNTCGKGKYKVYPYNKLNDSLLPNYKAEFKKNMDIVRKIDKNIKTIYTKEA